MAAASTTDDYVLVSTFPTIEDVLRMHRGALGADFDAYRNHTYRVANYCLAHGSRSDRESVEKVAIASAFHDLGIWTAHTFDYLEPSIALAAGYLARADRAAWVDEVSAMIREHHKVSRYRGEPSGLVEAFRRADWADVSWGTIASGLPRAFIRRVQTTWPNAGFHRRLAQLQLHRLRTHPWSPLPMVRL